jgi:hypothetical protein
MLRDDSDGQLRGDTEQVLVELYQLRCQIRISNFKEELRREAATVRRALNAVFQEIEHQEGDRL